MNVPLKIQPIKKGSGMNVTLKPETLKTYHETNYIQV